MGAARMEQQRVQGRFITQQEQPLRIGVQAADGINARRKTEFRQRPIGRAIAGKLRQHAVGFVKCNEHAGQPLTPIREGSKNNW